VDSLPVREVWRIRDKNFFNTFLSGNLTDELHQAIGEPGSSDTFEICAWKPLSELNTNPTFRAGGVLQGGNIMIHNK
jgi:hypothetical protein